MNTLTSDIAQSLSVVPPYEVGVNDSSIFNIPTSTIPLCIRSSDTTEQIATCYDNPIFQQTNCS